MRLLPHCGFGRHMQPLERSCTVHVVMPAMLRIASGSCVKFAYGAFYTLAFTNHRPGNPDPKASGCQSSGLWPSRFFSHAELACAASAERLVSLLELSPVHSRQVKDDRL